MYIYIYTINEIKNVCNFIFPDCPFQVCENNGTLSLSNCTCMCIDPFTGPLCENGNLYINQLWI